jgi:predicted permease
MAELKSVIDDIRRDLRLGFRSLARSPVFVVVTVLSLSLGIAGATGLFGFINVLAFRSSPHVAEPDRLVTIYSVDVTRQYGPLSYPDIVDLAQQVDALEGVAAFGHADPTVTLPSGAERTIHSEQVSEDYFDLLGVAMSRGRGFEAADAELDWDVVVLGHRMWQRDFGGDPTVIGSTLRIDGRPHTIVGIAPPGLQARNEPFVLELWLPVRRSWRGARNIGGLNAVGRMRTGASLEQVQAQLDLMAQRLVEEYPDLWRDYHGQAMGLAALSERAAKLPPNHRAQVVVVSAGLLTVVMLVLLVACANVANLQLARASRRRKEIAVRLALGAGRRRLVWQLLTESLILALIAGGLGLLITHVITDLFAKGRGPIQVPVALDLGVDPRVAAFSLVLAVMTGVAFGLAPALQTSRPDLVPALKGDESGRRGRRLSLRNLLVMAQVAGSLVLVVAAALLLRSLHQVRKVDLGFDPRNVAVMSLDLKHRQYEEAEGRRLLDNLGQRLRALPGVEAVSLARTVMLGPVRMSVGVEPEGYQPAPDELVAAVFNTVGAGYFEVVRIPIVRGRDFAPSDTTTSEPVVIVSQGFVDRFWPGEEPIGILARRGADRQAGGGERPRGARGGGGAGCQVLRADRGRKRPRVGTVRSVVLAPGDSARAHQRRPATAAGGLAGAGGSRGPRAPGA